MASETIKCSECSWSGQEDELDPVTHLGERVGPGEEMPLGECPECGELLYEVTKEQEAKQDFIARVGKFAKRKLNKAARGLEEAAMSWARSRAAFAEAVNTKDCQLAEEAAEEAAQELKQARANFRKELAMILETISVFIQQG